MKKIYNLLLMFVFAMSMNATSYTVSIVGNAYSPSTLATVVGDVVTIQADGSHPLVEVDLATWNANGSTPKAGGFGTKTSNYTFTITNTNTIYYVCSSHVSSGMKGQVTASLPASIKELNPIAGLSLFPNPVTEKLNISFNANINGILKGKLFNVCGGEIQSSTIDENYEAGEVTISYILPARIPQGIYLLELIYGNKKSIHKIIVE